MQINFFKNSIEKKLLGVLILTLALGFGIQADQQIKTTSENMTEQSKQKLELMVITIVKSIEDMMITGNAAIVGDWALDLKKIKEVASVEVIRPNGAEAFLDNKTIDHVNNELGDDLFDQRSEVQEERIVKVDKGKFEELLNTQKNVIYFENEGELLTLLSPIKTNEECVSCHTDESIRGVLKITTSMQEINDEIQAEEKQIAVMALLNIIIVAGILAFLIRKVAVKPIRNVMSIAERVANGDLTSCEDIREGAQSEDEIGKLAASFEKMRASLAEMVKQIQEGGMQISSASNQIQASAEEQARGAEAEASSVAEVTATIEELSRTANRITENSSDVVSTATETLNAVENGRFAVSECHKGMEEIMIKTQESTKKIVSLGDKSRQIGDVVNMINEIAVETKMLSLNAAIEASKAGEAGKGFSVVSVEIRKLAENVVKSTSTIRSIIDEIMTHTNASVMATEDNLRGAQSGVALVNKVNESLEQIMKMSDQTMELSQQISSANGQQKDATEQIVSTMQELSNSAKQNSVSAKESSAAVEQINAMANQLRSQVGKFR